MKNTSVLWLFCLLLSSCSFLARHVDEEPPLAEKADGGPTLESEIARLNTKMAALETKLDVLSSSMERTQLEKSQPVIEAETAAVTPQPNMAAPVDMPAQLEIPPQVSAAPARPNTAIANSSEVEKEFKSAMTLFQTGKNAEASAKFTIIAQKFPRHLLASHALYWSGEANARNQQWSTAIDNWEELEKRYPRSAYVPEAMAGLSKAYETQGNTGKAMSYKANLKRSFPKSPIALNLANESKPKMDPKEEENVPAFEEGKSESQGESE